MKKCSVSNTYSSKFEYRTGKDSEKRKTWEKTIFFGKSSRFGNDKKKLKFLILTIFAVIALLCISIGLLQYKKVLHKDLTKSSCDMLNYIMEQQRFTFASKLQDQKNAMKIYATSFENAWLFSKEELVHKLNVVRRNSSFDYISYVELDGSTTENTGVQLNVKDRKYFQRALMGETVIADPVKSKITNENIVTFSTPVIKNGNISAVLVGIYSADNLSNSLMPSFGGKGYTYIVTNAGEVIVKTYTNSSLSTHNNLLKTYDTVSFIGFNQESLDDSKMIRAKIKIGESGHSAYIQGNEKRLMHYSPVGINDWYVFSVAPDAAIAPASVEIMYSTTTLMLAMVGIFTIALAYFLITQQQHYTQLKRIAFVDDLTGAANGKRFKLVAQEILAKTRYRYAFVFLDIDKFKVLNDTLGYKTGDAVLTGIVDILFQNIGHDEFFCRYDSDEYYLLLKYEGDSMLRNRIQNIISEIENGFKLAINEEYSLVLCVGVYVIAGVSENINIVSDRARHAHDSIKGSEESNICFYNEDMRNQILAEKEIENKMHSAIKNKEFLIYLQPKYLLENEEIYGAEALVRWDTGEDGLIFPNQFIPIFERNGFILKLDMYMLEKACQTIREWIDAGITPIPISINFSRAHLKTPTFVDNIACIVHKYAVPEYLIEVELTESAMLHNESVLISMLKQLHSYGFTLSMDDFGSGYSSLGLLKNLPVDVIKLDRTFFVDYCEVKRAITVIASTISMAKNLGVKTVAEGVETKEQIELLKELGCDIVQGYYYARPMPVKSLTEILEQIPMKNPLTEMNEK